MNLNLIQPKNKTEDLLLSITKNCDTLTKQTHREAEETLEFKFTGPIQTKRDWMMGLISVEVYNSIHNLTEVNCYFEPYTDPSHEYSFVNLKDKVAEILDVSHISNEDLQHELLGLDIIKTYRKLSMEKSQTDGYYLLLNDYAHSSFRDFESYLRIVVGLDEEDI